MITKINTYLVGLIALVVISCGGGGDNPDTPPVVPVVEAPEAAVLKSPLKNTECNQGNIISDQESNVEFEWNASKNTDNYVLVLKNLESNKTTENSTSSTYITLTLLRGVAYSWKVVSKADGTTKTASSETWKLYNAGLPEENYAPFPADAISPEIGSLTSTTVTLEWEGSDIDNDIDSYNVYLSTENPPTTLYKTTTSNKIQNITLEADEVYYWSVVTKDLEGNSSESPVFDFRTQ